MSEADPTDPTRREGPPESAPKLKAVERGDAIGRYRVEDPIGEGGMGVVFSAIDPQLVRKVALKLVRPGGGAISQARLLREAQAMARLQHPNVVAIHDVGLYGQRVFIAMELVDGVTARRWLKQEPREWRDVLELFRGAGRGLAAAHAAGMVHRDFKLDNVLVDHDGRARVTDFGLARSTEDTTSDADESPATSLDSSPLTATGAVMGTPAYMAPEQRTPNAPTDARADEFSFCVSLYEALYGVRPFAKDGTAHEPPASSKVPAWISRILERGLAKDPEDRWPSMPALLDALARDPAVLRRRLLVGAGVLVLSATAIVAIVVRGDASPDCVADTEAAFAQAWGDTTRASMRAAFTKVGTSYVERAFATTSASLDRVSTAWRSSRIAACRATRESRTQSEEVMLLRMTCLERQRTELSALVEKLVVADGKTVELAVQAAGGLPRPSDCDDIRSLESTTKPPSDLAVRTEIERLRFELANASALPNIGRSRDAITQYAPVVARAKEIGYRPLEAEALYVLGFAQSAQGEYREAIMTLEAAALAAEAGNMDRLAVRVCTRLAALTSQSGRTAEATGWANRAAAIIERLGGDRMLQADLDFARGTANLASGRNAEAIPFLVRALDARQELLGLDHIDTLLARVNLGATYDELAQPRKAIEQNVAAIAGFERTLGPGHPRAIVVIANLAFVHVRVGEFAEAERLLVPVRELALAAQGPHSRRTAVVELFLANLRLAQDRAQDALTHARAAVDGFGESMGGTSDEFGQALVREGGALLALGKPTEAAATIRRGIAIRDGINREQVTLAEDLTLLGETELALEQPAAATMERALKLSAAPRYPMELARTRLVAARALATDRARARELAKQARDGLDSSPAHSALISKIDAFLRQLDPR